MNNKSSQLSLFGNYAVQVEVQSMQQQAVDLTGCPAILDPLQVGDVLNAMDRADTFALDCETTGLDYMRSELHGLAVSTPTTDAYITGPALYDALPKIAEIVANPKKLSVFHNAKFDLHFLTRYGVRPAKIADTMIAQWLVDENQDLGLKALAQSRLGMYGLPTFGDLLTDAKKRLKAKKKADVSIYDVDLSLLATYAARDTSLTLKLWPLMQYDLAADSMTDIFWNTEMPFVWTLLDMEQNGMYVDDVAVKALRVEFEEELNKYVKRWQELTGGANHNSSPQVGEILFNKLGLPVQDLTEKGKPSVAALMLQRLEPMDSTGTVAALRGIRMYEKMVNTFIEMLETKPFNGFLHGNFNQTGTVTGRLSSSDPNQQNIPSRGDLGKKMRSTFTAPEGYVVVVADYSQIEMRDIAHESKDENLLRAFAEGIDVHQMTADRAGVQRGQAKSLNFGWGYGMSYIGLMNSIEKAGLPRPSARDAKKWLSDYDRAYPTLVEWKKRVIRRARQLGYVPTVGGRRRRLPDLTSPNDGLRRSAERQCVNARIQGNCADMLKWSMLQLPPWEQMYGAKKTCQVHDELVWIAPRETAHEFAQVAGRVMAGIEQQFKLIVPIVVEPGIGPNWAEAK